MTEVALITGCATGIGRALALDLHARTLPDGRPAFRVYATDYRLDPLQELGQQGLQIGQLDVSSMDSVQSAISGILKAEGRIDLLVCNAGLALPGWISEIDYAQVERLFNVNVHGVFRCVQAVAPGMIERRKGKIAVMASVNSFYVSPFNGPYSGTKAAVYHMAEVLAQEMSPFGVKVTTIIPAWVKTEIINETSERFDRYERPDSFFEHTIEAIRQRRKAGFKLGCTVEKAAHDMGNGLSKKNPPRFLYTGATLLHALFWGCVQTWLRPPGLAEGSQGVVNLPEAAKLAPKEWKGPYQEPKKLPAAAAPEE